MGIEPTYKGFADLSLTTWVPRPLLEQKLSSVSHCTGNCLGASTSGDFDFGSIRHLLLNCPVSECHSTCEANRVP